MPPPWVWLIFSLSLGIFAASMMTWREGRRFASRPFRPQELRLVAQALALGERAQQDRSTLQTLADMLSHQSLRAMDLGNGARCEERSAFGYTDEFGRILINPKLCFLYLESTGQENPADLVATLATLIHESQHLLLRASEEQAYQAERASIQRFQLWAVQQGQSRWAEESSLWVSQLEVRARRYGIPKTFLASPATLPQPPGSTRNDKISRR